MNLTLHLSQVNGTANVLGLLPGSDPKLKDEVVVYTAHHDHLGVGQPDKTGDRIYNGAQDNASGCAAAVSAAPDLLLPCLARLKNMGFGARLA